jgi:hypothetical protein
MRIISWGEFDFLPVVVDQCRVENDLLEWSKFHSELTAHLEATLQISTLKEKRSV